MDEDGERTGKGKDQETTERSEIKKREREKNESNRTVSARNERISSQSGVSRAAVIADPSPIVIGVENSCLLNPERRRKEDKSRKNT